LEIQVIQVSSLLVIIDYYQQQQKNFANLNKPVLNSSLPYHSNLPQCNQNFNNLKQTINNDPLKKVDEIRKNTYTIKDIPDMTVGSFLSNKNMQQMYFSYVKNPGKEPEGMPMQPPLPSTSFEVTQIIEKPAIKTHNHTPNLINQSLRMMNTIKPNTANQSQYSPHVHTLQNQNQDIPQNTPKGFYMPSSGEIKNTQTNQALIPNNLNQNNQTQQGFSKQNSQTKQPIHIPDYPSVTNFNIQNYNFNNYNTNVPLSTSFSTQQFTSSANSGNITQNNIDSANFASSNLNLTTASGKSINIQKTSTIPKNNALVKTKLRITLPDSSDSLMFEKDFIPIKTSSTSSETPESLKNYIVRSFEKCSNDSSRKRCEQALQRIISNAKKKGQMTTRNWYKFPLPKLPGEIEDIVNNSILLFIKFRKLKHGNGKNKIKISL
jgi:hypothetical protein